VKITTITADSASSLVFQVLSALATNTPNHRWEVVAPRGMPTRELRWVWYRLDDVTRCITWLPERRLNYSFMTAEWAWIFSGSDDVAMIGSYNDKIKQFSDDGETFWGAYGPRWRSQIGGVIHRLKEDPTCRQAITCIWRPEYNRLVESEDELGVADHYMNTKDVPCTVMMQYMVRNNKLETGVVMRSSDAWLGLPYDIFNFSMLAQSVAEELGLEPGPLTLFIASSHLYDRDLHRVEEVLTESKKTAFTLNRLAQIEVPTPPRVMAPSLDKFMLAEKRIRAGIELTQDDIFDRRFDPWMSLLQYRFRKDPESVHELLRPLVEDKK
jgi:thymidylate synthase